MKKYKLTTQELTTHGGYQWAVGEWHEAIGNGTKLCSDGWLHCYDSPELATLLNPIHAKIENPRLWIVETRGRGLNDHGLKCGYKRMKLVREIKLPVFTPEQIVAFGILTALEAYGYAGFASWAHGWLSGEDRSARAAEAAARAAAVRAVRAVKAVRAAAEAAEAAAEAAAWAVGAVGAAWAAVATAAAVAAEAAAEAAASTQIDFSAIIKQLKNY